MSDTTHALAAWFGLPVCLQLRNPYLVPKNSGSIEVEMSEGNKRVYGLPLIYSDPQDPSKIDNSIMVAMSGELQPDGDRVMLYAHMAAVSGLGSGYRIRISIDPRDIAFITVITEPTQAPPAIIRP